MAKKRLVEITEDETGHWIKVGTREEVNPKPRGKPIAGLTYASGAYGVVRDAAKEQGVWDQVNAYSITIEKNAFAPYELRSMAAQLHKI